MRRRTRLTVDPLLYRCATPSSLFPRRSLGQSCRISLKGGWRREAPKRIHTHTSSYAPAVRVCVCSVVVVVVIGHATAVAVE